MKIRIILEWIIIWPQNTIQFHQLNINADLCACIWAAMKCDDKNYWLFDANREKEVVRISNCTFLDWSWWLIIIEESIFEYKLDPLSHVMHYKTDAFSPVGLHCFILSFEYFKMSLVFTDPQRNVMCLQQSQALIYFYQQHSIDKAMRKMHASGFFGSRIPSSRFNPRSSCDLNQLQPV